MHLTHSEDVEISFPPKILRLPMVKERTGLARSTIYLKISQGEFPKPISLGDRSVGWIEEEITSWIEQRIQSSRPTNEVINGNETKQQSSDRENALTSDNSINSKQDEKAIEEMREESFELHPKTPAF